MIVDRLIDHECASVSILEDRKELIKWLRRRDYYVVKDEEMHTVGIVIWADLLQHRCRQLIDCDLRKPHVLSGQSIIEVYELMKTSHCAYLPVYNQNDFKGVVSLWAITGRLLELGVSSTRTGADHLA